MPDSQDARHAAAPAGITRRDFNRRAARTAAGLLLAASAAAHAEEIVDVPTQPPPDLVPPDDRAAPSEPQPPGLMESVACVRSAVPSLPEGDLEELQRQVKSAMDLSRTLREAPLADGVEPGFVFSALGPARKARP